MIPRFNIIARLSEGTFGVVSLCQRSDTQQMLAVKSIDRTLLRDCHFNPDNPFQLMEICVMRELNHPNVVKYIGAIPTPDFFNIYMEFLNGRTVLNLIKLHKVMWTEATCCILRQVVEGLHHIHQKGFAHGDVKPHNIVVTKDWHVKLIDFGWAQKLNTQTCQKYGTPILMAPEVIDKKLHFPGPTDCWSLGVTLFMMVMGQPPFLPTESVLKKLVVADTVPKDLSDLVYSLIEVQIEKRMTIDALRACDWLMTAEIPAFPPWVDIPIAEQPAGVSVEAGKEDHKTS